MAADNAPAPLIKPLVEAKPGDPITAGRWNEMQSLLRSEHIQHAHTGTWKGDLYDGTPITAAGLANGAVTGPRIADRTITGDKLDPATNLTAHDITATGTLKASDLQIGGNLTVDKAITVGGNLSATTAAFTGALTVGTGLTVHGAALTANNGLGVKNGATISGPLTAGNGLTVSGAALSATSGLTVAGSFTANNGLTVHGSIVANGGLTVAGASLVANNGLTVTGQTTVSSLSVQSTLAVSGTATVKSRPIATGDAECPTAPRIVWGYIEENGSKRSGYGFTVETVSGPGVRIRFTSGFRDTPAVIVQQHGDGKTTDNALVYSVSAAQCIVYNGDNNGDKRMRAFFFMAIAAND